MGAHFEFGFCLHLGSEPEEAQAAQKIANFSCHSASRTTLQLRCLGAQPVCAIIRYLLEYVRHLSIVSAPLAAVSCVTRAWCVVTHSPKPNQNVSWLFVAVKNDKLVVEQWHKQARFIAHGASFPGLA